MINVDIRQASIPEALADFDDESFDLVHADPPYFRVLAEAWDRQWESREVYLGWLKTVLDGFQRVLKPNGSLYVWASATSAAAVEELCVRPRFDVLSSIVWAKGDRPGLPREEQGRRPAHKGRDLATLRTWFGETERLIFAEHLRADGVAMRDSGYGAKVAGLRGNVFEPLRAYLDGEREAAGVTPGEVNAALGNQMAGHYFGRSQWALPTAENYAKLQELFNRGGEGDGRLRREYEDLRREYEDLRREYEDLRREYEDLRRPFFAPADGFTDVWTFAPAELVPGRHPAEKPLDMMRHILEASTRPGALVLDAFSGSGSMSAACVDLGREVVAIEEDAALCEDIRRRVERHRAVKTGEMHRAEMRPITGPLFKVKR
jgi:site-specific DNA-methyltransferase (adenine-specific)